MIETILLQQVSPAHPLVLISDPDGILNDEALLASLTGHGYALVREADPVALRCELLRLRAEPGQPVAVITKRALDSLPYDLWQQGQHVTLALPDLFPLLDYPAVELLRGGALARLADAYQAQPPARPLSPVETQDYLLRAVFDAAPERLDRPASLLLWLDSHHQQPDDMPLPLLQRLLAQLKDAPALAGWPLWSILLNPEAYREFVREAWQREVGMLLREAPPEYRALPFGEDVALQDALPRLVRTGTVAPLALDRAVSLPAWASPALAVDAAAVRRRQIDEAIADVAELLAPDELRWAQWQTIARRWAQLTLWRYDYDTRLTAGQRDALAGLDDALDRRFAAWLQGHYALLAGQALPTPHHLFHALRTIDHVNQRLQRVALLVLDGMSLADWTLIRQTWQARHDEWNMAEHLVLTQVPGVTSVARQALVSGLRPERLADTLLTTGHEAQRWRQFWQTQNDLPAERIAYASLPDRLDAPLPEAVSSPHTSALCLVSTVIDNMVHGATQGAADALASLRLWLADGARRLEALIEQLLDDGYALFLASDHGHVEAVGMGQPQEGVLVESRSLRARLYSNADFSRTVQAQYPETSCGARTTCCRQAGRRCCRPDVKPSPPRACASSATAG